MIYPADWRPTSTRLLHALRGPDPAARAVAVPRQPRYVTAAGQPCDDASTRPPTTPRRRELLLVRRRQCARRGAQLEPPGEHRARERAVHLLDHDLARNLAVEVRRLPPHHLLERHHPRQQPRHSRRARAALRRARGWTWCSRGHEHNYERPCLCRPSGRGAGGGTVTSRRVAEQRISTPSALSASSRRPIVYHFSRGRVDGGRDRGDDRRRTARARLDDAWSRARGGNVPTTTTRSTTTSTTYPLHDHHQHDDRQFDHDDDDSISTTTRPARRSPGSTTSTTLRRGSHRGHAAPSTATGTGTNLYPPIPARQARAVVHNPIDFARAPPRHRERSRGRCPASASACRPSSRG